jgi:hypothetical protein
MSSPIALTDLQLVTVIDAARHLRLRDRGAFLERIAEHLRGVVADPGDGDVDRAIRAAAAEMKGARLSYVAL